MSARLTVSYPNVPPESTGVLTLDHEPDLLNPNAHHMSLDINVMGCGGADDSTPVVCSCGHHLVTLGALRKMWKAEPPDGIWDMPEVPLVCRCGTLYLVRGFDYEA